MNPGQYSKEVARELRSILRYWMEQMPDPRQGGFFGRIDEKGRVDATAPKGLVLNSRICWTFSAAFHHTGDPRYLPPARRAYDYLLTHFLDRQYGGARWSVDRAGHPLDDRKQIYGLAFCLYGLSEFFIATGEQTSLEEAIALFRIIEQYSFDPTAKGYYEAFARDWQPLADQRLSGKDANTPKTMNTHLHVLEAYANLYRAWPDALLLQRIKDLLEVFEQHIIDPTTGHRAPIPTPRHLSLFFDKDWKRMPGVVSYGHDIEASWLLHEAAIVTGDKDWIATTRRLALQLAQASLEGLDKDGGLWYEEEGGQIIGEKHWWPQAEAMVGYLNAWQISEEEIWWQRSVASWDFVKKYIRDTTYGEWFWGVWADHIPMPRQDKAGFWKCPYHNTRACLEIIRRLPNLP